LLFIALFYKFVLLYSHIEKKTQYFNPVLQAKSAAKLKHTKPSEATTTDKLTNG